MRATQRVNRPKEVKISINIPTTATTTNDSKSGTQCLAKMVPKENMTLADDGCGTSKNAGHIVRVVFLCTEY